MDPKVLAHYDGDVTRANIHPRARRRLIAKYGTARAAAAR
jgi:alkane 1-monooxygenase